MRLANTMSSKLHVCLLQTIGAEVIEPVLWSSLVSRNISLRVLLIVVQDVRINISSSS